MAKKAGSGLSPRRRTKKVDTPVPSTTSMTIGENEDATTLSAVDVEESHRGETAIKEQRSPLSLLQQNQVLEWMLKGAGPGQACLQLGVTVDQFWDTLQDDPAFAAALQKLFDTLSQNVLAALYQSAMKGNASAQQFWLKQRPATHWTTVVPDADEDASHSLSRLSDDQLVDECRAAGLDLPADFAARTDSASGVT